MSIKYSQNSLNLCYIQMSLFPKASSTDPYCELHLLPEPLFCLPSDNISMISITGTCTGRIFLTGRDGCLYELLYQVNYRLTFDIVNLSVYRLKMGGSQDAVVKSTILYPTSHTYYLLFYLFQRKVCFVIYNH